MDTPEAIPDEGKFQSKKVTDLSNKTIAKDVRTWNLRLGHALPVKTVRRCIKQDLLPHVKCEKTDCMTCLKGKCRRSYDGSLTSATSVGMIQVDTKGKLETASVNGDNLFVTLVEEYSIFVSVYPIKTKADAT